MRTSIREERCRIGERERKSKGDRVGSSRWLAL